MHAYVLLMISRACIPLLLGGFCWELRSKYPHDENLVELFQRLFNAIPIAAIVGEWGIS